MRIPYEKPYLDIRGQIDLLKSRGMIITDEPKATSYLERLGYYRLSGYWYRFQDILLYPPEPNERLQRALAKHGQNVRP